MNRKIARFRFYEELNDFLPRNKRKISFEHYFEGNPGIKDVIEALGVPHAEVDMILVNGQSVDFEYRLQDGDRAAVYPVFEALDISTVSKVRQAPLREPRFILDVHLGKLAKRLRLLGFDTLYRNDLQDNEIVDISLKEKRIILTRDIGLLKNKKVTHGYWLRSRQPKRQLREIVSRFDLKNLIRPFTRCLECNGVIHPVEKEAVLRRLPPNTRKYYQNFFQCAECGKIYWEGSHYQKMVSFLKDFENIAGITAMPGTGKLEAIWIKRFKRGPMDSVSYAALQAGAGLLGNANQGGKRQVTIIEKEIWTALMEKLGASVNPSARRANLMISGVSLLNSRGKILQVGNCRIRIWGNTRPCERMDEALPGLREAMLPDWGGGAFGEILDDGEIYLGDEVKWVGEEA